MRKEFNIVLPAEIGMNVDAIKKWAIHHESLSSDANIEIILQKRSIDARQKNIKTNLKFWLLVDETFESKPIERNYQFVKNTQEVIIVGAGPAGLFAALKCLESGLKPIVIERGKDVRTRRRDLAILNKEGKINPESNYCFGEGGAGTYSDGKLYTRSDKRGEIKKILETLVLHGADPNILVEAHPHVGTNKLPRVIQNIRETILNFGGEILFEEKVTEFLIQNKKILGVKTEKGNIFKGISVVLATGHSARDIYKILKKQNIILEIKPLAMGIRIEHPQPLIDKIQYHTEKRPDYLPPSSYSWVQQVQGRGVYSFCMCPGGVIAPCATAEQEIVTNGWSPSRRNNPYANSGIVVEIRIEDSIKYSKSGTFALHEYQKELEHQAFLAGGGSLKAPAQRMVDFINQKFSNSLPECSYFPGLTSSNLNDWLPREIGMRLKEGFQKIGKIMKDYLTNEATIVGVESRTSTPVRIPRDKISLEHVEIQGLYPCGEGAGYAGGIVSAAIDGEKVVQKIVEKFRKD